MSLSKAEALELFRSDDLIGIGMEGDAVRRKLHPDGVVSYIIDRNINYTNFCTEYCTFCAFYRPLKGPQAKEGYILDFDTIYQKIAETAEMGGTGVLMQGGIHPDLKIDWFESLFTGIKQRFPKIWLHCLSASEVLAIAEYSDLDLRINHFEVVRRLQEETGGFTAFIPWSFQPKYTALGGRGWDEATSVEYLKVLAISRLFLDNIENVQASWVTQGLKVLELGLRFGGNDVGSVMLEENVVRAAGTSNCTTEEELRRIIRDAGFRPVQRDTLYRTYFLN